MNDEYRDLANDNPNQRPSLEEVARRIEIEPPSVENGASQEQLNRYELAELLRKNGADEQIFQGIGKFINDALDANEANGEKYSDTEIEQTIVDLICSIIMTPYVGQPNMMLTIVKAAQFAHAFNHTLKSLAADIQNIESNIKRAQQGMLKKD